MRLSNDPIIAYDEGFRDGKEFEKKLWDRLEKWMDVERTKRVLYGSDVSDKMIELRKNNGNFAL